MPSCALTISVHKKFAPDLFYEIDVYVWKNAWTFSYHKTILDLTEAGSYPQLPTQPKYVYPFQTYTAI